MASFYREPKDQLLWKYNACLLVFSTFRMEWELYYVWMSAIEVIL